VEIALTMCINAAAVFKTTRAYCRTGHGPHQPYWPPAVTRNAERRLLGKGTRVTGTRPPGSPARLKSTQVVYGSRRASLPADTQ
jgi:hypothetical protein